MVVVYYGRNAVHRMRKGTSVLQRLEKLAWLLSLGLSIGSSAFCQSLYWLSTFGGSSSQANDVSADGRTVVGWAKTNSEDTHAFRWEEGTLQDLGTLPNRNQSVANSVSAEGGTIVGTSWYQHDWMSTRYAAFLWQEGEMQEIENNLNGPWSFAEEISADGSVIVGTAMNSNGYFRAFRWNGRMVDLGTLGGRMSGALGVSDDGAVVVGWSEVRINQPVHAFRWTEEGGMQDLGTLGGDSSTAHDVSASGSVVAGSATTATGETHAFRWTESRGMEDLGTLGGDKSEALDISADGKVIVGWARTASGEAHAFRWTGPSGMEDLNTTYVDLLRNGSRLIEARATSPNGRYIVGRGYNAARGREEAFLLDTGFPLPGDVDQDGCVSDMDLALVLRWFGTRGYRNEDLNWDGFVDDADLAIVLRYYGKGC